MDVDGTSSYGPETITVTFDDRKMNGDIKYYVHDYTNSGSTNSVELSNSSATVKIYNGQKLIKTFNSELDNIGVWWHVFNMNNRGDIEIVNQYTNEPVTK